MKNDLIKALRKREAEIEKMKREISTLKATMRKQAELNSKFLELFEVTGKWRM